MVRLTPERAECAVRKLLRIVRTWDVSGVNIRFVLQLTLNDQRSTISDHSVHVLDMGLKRIVQVKLQWDAARRSFDLKYTLSTKQTATTS